MRAVLPRIGRLAGVLALATPLAAGLASPGAAFSQIDPGESGRPASREGIIAVPLPPLDDVPAAAPAGAASPSVEPAPAAEPTETAPIDGLEAPNPEVPDAASGDGASPGTSPAAGSGAGDAAVPDSASDPAEAAPEADAPGLNEPPAAVDGAAPLAPPTSAGDAAQGGSDDTGTAPDAASIEPVRYGEDGLPAPVRDLRRRLIEVARTGRIEGLRPYLETGAEPTLVSFGETPEDPIAFLKSISGDGEGAEILAILIEVLEAGHAHVESGSDAEIFIWPYFAQADLEQLTPPQKVELFELVTAGDFEAMKSFGAYNFYRAGISPEGRLEFFVAGD